MPGSRLPPPTRHAVARAVARVTAPLALAACAGAPTYMRAHGAAAAHEAALGWRLTAISCAVVVIVAALVLAAMLRPRPVAEDASAVRRQSHGTGWILIGGVVVPTVILVVAFADSAHTLALVAAPPRPPAVTVRVTGHRWWWEVEYVGAAPGESFRTANELHVPVGRPVRVELASADVIHSFWVPQIAGKTDAIPGQTNVTWLEADSAGVYVGQCAEYCGVQHAHMALRLVAESPAAFAAWRAHQLAPAAEPAGVAAGHAAFLRAPCTLCHTVRGGGADGRAGPDLTHVASRLTLAAGTLPNRRGYLSGWVANAPALKPGSLMPAMSLSAADLRDIVAYLETLR